MTPRPGPHPPFLVIAAVVAGAVGISIFWQIFSVFMLYDDEGYVLHSLNEFTRHGQLYDRVYTQYGPLFYLIGGGFCRLLGLEWTHDLSRIVTGLAWFTTAGASGLLTNRLTGSHWWGLFGFVATSAHLGQMAHEPMHPGNIITPVVAIGALVSVTFLQKNKSRSFVVTIAATTAVCALIKINVGGFVGLAAVTWWGIFVGPSIAGSRILRGLSWLMPLVIPAVLMHRHLHEPWGITFSLLMSVGLLSTFGLNRTSDFTSGISWSDLGIGAIVALAIVGLAFVGIGLSGTSWQGLWQGMISGPLAHADIYSHGPNWRNGTLLLTVMSIGVLFTLQKSGYLDSDWGKRVVFAVRLGLVVTFVIWGLTIPSQTVAGVMTILFGSMGWLLLSTRLDHHSLRASQSWIAFLLLWQFLHAYPVAGTQLTWGTFLWIPLLLSSLANSIRSSTRVLISQPWQFRSVSVGCGVLALILLGSQMRAAHFYYRHSESLNLPGARLLRVPPGVGTALRINAANAALNADQLYSLPGSFSFNLWTGLPTPTSANTTHWVTLLSTEQQQEIVDELERSPRDAWISQPYFSGSWLEATPNPTTPLLTYLKTNYDRALQIDGIELYLRSDRANLLINYARFFLPESSLHDQVQSQMVEVNLGLPVGTKISRIEVHSFVGDRVIHDPIQDWSAANTSVTLRQLPSPGALAAGFRPTEWPITSLGLFTLRLEPRGPLPETPIKYWWLRFFDSKGTGVAEARFDTLANN